MKTLKFVLAAATAIGLPSASFAQYSKEVNVPLSSQDFNSLPTGTFTPASANGFAAYAGDNDSEIVEISDGNNALHVSVDTDPILRMIAPGNDAAQPIDLTNNVNKVYIDTKIQFTVTPASETIEPVPEDKLKIYLKETIDGGVITTNLYVMASEFKYDSGSHEFVATLRDIKTNRSDIRPNEWYRLVIETTKGDTALGTYIPLFKISLGLADGEPTAVTSGDVDLYNGDHEIFPSLRGAEVAPTLTYLGFAGETMVDDLAFSKDATVYSVDFTYTLANVSDVTFVVNDTTTNKVWAHMPYTVAPIFPGDVIALEDATYYNGFLPGTPTATGFASVANGRYTVGDSDCSLEIAGAPLPEPKLNGGATAYLNRNNTYSFSVPMGCAISSLTVNGASIGDAIGKQLYEYQVTSLDVEIEVTAAPFVARVDNPNPDPANMYLTLKEAVEAAQEGAEVTILTNCTVSAPIVFTNGITLVNNRYDVSLEANYALRFANGTNTPVRIVQIGTYDNQGGDRSGAFIWNSGSGSPFLVGSNEAKSGYGITGTYSGSLVLQDVMIAAGSASDGNLIKIENGSFELTGMGSVIGGKRCVKADADAGEFTALVSINGGTVSNSTTAAIMASATDGGLGTAAVTIAGGTIYGKITETNTTGTATVTIRGDVIAYFDHDQTDFCEAGYETRFNESIGLYYVRHIACKVYFNVDGVNVQTNDTTWGMSTWKPYPDPWKDSHEFNYWYVSDPAVPYDFETPVEQRELTLYAKFTKTSGDVVFTFNLGEGVSGIEWQIVGAFASSETNGTAYPGTAIMINSVTYDDWYLASGNVTNGATLVAADTTFDVTAMKQSSAIEEGTTPASIGITEGAFATADAAELRKVAGWAEANGKSKAAVNAMTFSAPLNPTADEKSYLLGIGTEGAMTEEAAVAALEIDSIDFVGGKWVIKSQNNKGNGDPLANGHIAIFGATDVAGPYSAGQEGKRFFKAVLVK